MKYYNKGGEITRRDMVPMKGPFLHLNTKFCIVNGGWGRKDRSRTEILERGGGGDPVEGVWEAHVGRRRGKTFGGGVLRGVLNGVRMVVL